MDTLKKFLPILCALLVAGIFIYSFVSDVYSPKTQYSFACGSEVRITVFKTPSGEKAAKKAIDEVLRLDGDLLSDTKNTSAVYKLNSTGEYTDSTGELISYINECKGLIAKCDKMTLLSKPFTAAWDISGEGRVPSEAEVAEALKKSDMSNLKVSGSRIELSRGAEISFGAFGKGTVCEAAVDVLQKNGAKGGLVSVGGTVGVFGKQGKSDVFTVGVRDPFGGSGDYFATLNVSNCYLSTSGDYEKYFEKGGKRYCHIFDATTGYPAESDITSVTVICSGGTRADFLSTAIFILGEQGTELAKSENAEVIIVKKDKSVLISKSLQDKFSLTDDSFTVSVIE